MAKDKGKGKKSGKRHPSWPRGSRCVRMPGRATRSPWKDEPQDEARPSSKREMEELQGRAGQASGVREVSGARSAWSSRRRDTAGKGSLIRRITERVSPRVSARLQLSAPTDGRSPRCTSSLHGAPAGGRRSRVFDRSWYNRAGVSALMGFSTEGQVEGFLQNVRWSRMR